MSLLKLTIRKKENGKMCKKVYKKEVTGPVYSRAISDTMKFVNKLTDDEFRTFCTVEMLRDAGYDEGEIIMAMALEDSISFEGTSFASDLLDDAGFNPWTDEQKVRALYRYGRGHVTLSIDGNPIFFDDTGHACDEKAYIKLVVSLLVSEDIAIRDLPKYPKAFNILKEIIDTYEESETRRSKKKNSDVCEHKDAKILTPSENIKKEEAKNTEPVKSEEKNEPEKENIALSEGADALLDAADEAEKEKGKETEDKENDDVLVRNVIKEIMKPYHDEGYAVSIFKVGGQLFADLETDGRYVRTLHLPFDLDLPAGKHYELDFTGVE